MSLSFGLTRFRSGIIPPPVLINPSHRISIKQHTLRRKTNLSVHSRHVNHRKRETRAIPFALVTTQSRGESCAIDCHYAVHTYLCLRARPSAVYWIPSDAGPPGVSASRWDACCGWLHACVPCFDELQIPTSTGRRGRTGGRQAPGGNVTRAVGTSCLDSRTSSLPRIECPLRNCASAAPEKINKENIAF